MNIQGCIVAGNEHELNAIVTFINKEQYIMPCNNYALFGIDFNITPQLLIAMQAILPNINKVDSAYNTSKNGVIYTTNTQLNWVQNNATQFAFIINNNMLAITNGLLFVANAIPNNKAVAFETVLKKELKIYVSSLAKGNSDLEVMQTAIQLRYQVQAFNEEGRSCFSEVIKNQHNDKTLTEIANYYAQKINSNLVLLHRSNKLILELLFNNQVHLLLY